MKDQMASPIAMSLSDKKNRQVCTDLISKLIELFSDSVDYGNRNMFIPHCRKELILCINQTSVISALS